jgi:hypothetical protein
MNRQKRIESIRNWLKSCKQEVMLGKKLFPDTFEEETHKITIKHLDNLILKVSKIIEDIINKRPNNCEEKVLLLCCYTFKR